MTFPRFGLALGVCLLAAPLRADPPAEVRFNRDVRPILSNRCFKCHGPDLKKGGLDLKQRDTALAPLKSKARAIVPGDGAASRLLARVSSGDESERMPPKGEPLTPQQIATLRRWIEQGANYEEHWAYVKPARPALPAVRRAGWARNGLDLFVLARLEQEGLAPSPEADRATLLRRAALDLTGLPPTLEDLDAYLRDDAAGAYERAVERLLASPHYGEHQARYWLDLARYADTNGYEKDDRRTIWPWRDWVIHAFNRDLPFDQFTVEQLAGDRLPGATTDQKVATGFHRNTMVNTEGGTDDEEFRIAAVVDRVNTTMAVWMGTTMGCAQCHNHKYDPFTQQEYYQFFAFFNSTEDRGRANDPTLPAFAPEQMPRVRALDDAIADLNRQRAAAVLLGPTYLPVLEARQAALRKELAAIKPAVTTLVLREMDDRRDTYLLIRGNHKNQGDAVMPGIPAKFHPLPPGRPDRLALARWLVSPDNPLTGRVTMNRLWARYFGRGLVETSEDFGTQGEPPTHPELLDWLATELVHQKWGLKAMHRLIVTSAAYRQSSRVTPESARRDPFNRLLGRGPRLRLDAEGVRDNALAVGGLLCRKVGGPSVFPYQPDGVWFNPYSGDKWVLSPGGDAHRRGLYTFWRRTSPYAAFMAFDAPSREVCAERRPRTNTPLQALATLNDKVFVEASAALARRLLSEVEGGPAARVAHGFRLCLARAPTAAESEVLVKLYEENLAKYRTDPAAAAVMAKNGAALPGSDAAAVAAWTVVANVLLNLDEMITKG